MKISRDGVQILPMIKYLMWFVLFGCCCEIVSSSDDGLNEFRFQLLESLEKNRCSWRRSCATNQIAAANFICDMDMNNFVLLSPSEQRLCANPREPSCQWLHFRRVCAFICDPTQWETDEALRHRRNWLPQTGTRSLSTVLGPMREIGGQRLRDAYQRWKQGVRMQRLHQQLHPQAPMPALPEDPLLPGPFM